MGGAAGERFPAMRRLFQSLFALLLAAPLAAQDLETLRPVADQGAAERAKLVQVMVDSSQHRLALGVRDLPTSNETLRENGSSEEGTRAPPPGWRVGAPVRR